MAPKYKCEKCQRTYDEPPQDRVCVTCDIPLTALTAENPLHAELAGTTSLTPVSGVARGLGILICDISNSTDELAFPGESQITKLELTVQAIQHALDNMDTMSEPDKAYLAIIAFGRRATLIKDRSGKPFIKSVQAIRDEEGSGLGAFLYEQFVTDAIRVDRGATDITAALSLARKLADAALAGSLETFGGPKTELKTQTVTRENKPDLEMPNIRAMIYSDGKHNQDTLQNPFASLQPVSILMTAFLGSETVNDDAKLGADQMRWLATNCPKHEFTGYFLINTLKRQSMLRDLYHMTTGASGFCLKCMIKKAHGLAT
jgi:hypothetical protein